MGHVGVGTGPPASGSDDVSGLAASDAAGRVLVADDRRIGGPPPGGDSGRLSVGARSPLSLVFVVAGAGGARNVIVSLSRLERVAVLRVVDDGCGSLSADVAAPEEGHGLRRMRERAAVLGGYLTAHQPRWGGA